MVNAKENGSALERKHKFVFGIVLAPSSVLYAPKLSPSPVFSFWYLVFSLQVLVIFQHVDEFLHRLNRFLEHFAFVGQELDFDDFFDAGRSQLTGHAEV